MSLKLYTGLGSGNAYKAELMLHLLDVPFEAVSVSIPRGEHRNPEFLRLNPFGQIPVLVDGDTVLTDSQAILAYLATAHGGSATERWWPREPKALAAVMRWLSVAGNEIQNTLTAARAVKLLRWPLDYDRAVSRGYALLRLMDDHLQARDWLATADATVADIACYPYTLLAAEGGIDTRPYRAVEAWLRRVESLPRFWPMPRIPNLPAIALVPPPD
jgi:glutathione S-transferase